jgi:mono/diheme cytochrome c family protein
MACGANDLDLNCFDLALKLNFFEYLIKFIGVYAMNHLKLGLVLLAATAFVVSCSQPASTPNTKNAVANANNTVATTPAQPAATVDELALAGDLYSKNCMICHKDTGKGGKVTIEGKSLDPIDLTSAKVKARSDDKLLSQIKDGSPEDGMPAFKEKLTDDQIKSLVKHLRKLQAN